MAAHSARAGVKPVSFHGGRHTHVSLLLKQGAPIKAVSERVEHSSPNVTMGVYAHLLPGMGRQAANNFDLAFTPESGYNNQRNGEKIG